MNKKFAFGIDPSKKITFSAKPIKKTEFGTKETAFNKPKATQPKIEIPKATLSTTTYERGRSPFSVLLEDKRSKKLRTKRRPLVKNHQVNLLNQYLKVYRRLL